MNYHVNRRKLVAHDVSTTSYCTRDHRLYYFVVVTDPYCRRIVLETKTVISDVFVTAICLPGCNLEHGYCDRPNECK